MRNPVDGVKIETVKKVEEIDPQALLNQEEYKAVPKELRSRFLKALDEEKNSPFLKPLCYLMYFAGNRVGEALAYQWKDFNFERRFFFVYKSLTKEYEFDEQGEVIGTGKTVLKPPKSKEGIRPLPLLDILYEVMMEWYDYRKAQEKVSGLSFTGPDDYVFSTNQGKMRTEGGTYTIFRRFLVIKPKGENNDFNI
ncbi:MAG: tyrosine-type recombinase/integrase [Clostridia bacterium]|nr:tyrosine-type recombinase/integrase [Clostridia bacterium]